MIRRPPRSTLFPTRRSSDLWRVYRSGIFGLRGELAMESWSRGTAGLDTAGALRILPGVTIGEVNVEVRIAGVRSEEHTSELQSPCNLVCRLLLEKKK